MVKLNENTTWSQDRFQVLRLAFCQAFMMSGTTLIMTSTALSGAYLSDQPAYATLPLAIMFVGVMCATVPASLLMGRIGRKLGFTIGFASGIFAALLAVYALFLHSFWLFCLASFGLGINNAFIQFLRFAATEVCEKERHPQAISYVLGGGLIAAFLGPWLAAQTRTFFDPVLFAGAYSCLCVLYGLAIIIIQFVKFPKYHSVSQTEESARPLRIIARQPAFLTAILTAALGYGVMSFVMTATPLAMTHSGHLFEDAAFIIQWHVVGMFLPSFFTGKLIQKYGVLKIIAAGIILNLISMTIALQGESISYYWFALVSLGVGWNFMYIGGSTLLTYCYHHSERSKTQALNDFVVSCLITSSSFASGAIQNIWGWFWVNSLIALPLFLSLAVLLWMGFHVRFKGIRLSALNKPS